MTVQVGLNATSFVTCRRCRRGVERLLRKGLRVETSPFLSEVPADMAGVRCGGCRRVFVVTGRGEDH